MTLMNQLKIIKKKTILMTQLHLEINLMSLCM